MQRNSRTDLFLFLIGAAIFCGGVFLFTSQIVAATSFAYRSGWGRYGSASFFPFGTPGMGLWLVPLGIGICLLMAGAYRRWAWMMIWGSASAMTVGILNGIRLTFMPTSLFQLAAYIMMIAAGAGLIIRSLAGWDRGVDG